MNICCENCQNWKETQSQVRVGRCSVLNILTEWQAGTVYRVGAWDKPPKRVKYCEFFKPNVV